MKAPDYYLTALLQQKRKSLLALAETPSIEFTRPDGSRREICKNSLLRCLSHVCQELQRQRG